MGDGGEIGVGHLLDHLGHRRIVAASLAGFVLAQRPLEIILPLRADARDLVVAGHVRVVAEAAAMARRYCTPPLDAGRLGGGSGRHRRRQLRKLFAFAAAGLAIAFTAPALAQQTVKVGSTPTGIPFTFLDTQSNTIQGVMVDIITAIGKDAGFSVQVEPMQFSTLIGALTSNRIDVVAAAMYITEPRKQVIDFSDPIYTYGDGLFVPKADTKEYKTLEDLKGLTVGAQVGTAYVEPLQKSGFFPEVKIYDTLPDIIRDVNAGRLKAGFADYPIVAYNLQQGRFPDVRLASGYKPMVVGSVGIGVRKSDQELLKKINTSLAKIKGDGTLKQILAKWGLQD